QAKHRDGLLLFRERQQQFFAAQVEVRGGDLHGGLIERQWLAPGPRQVALAQHPAAATPGRPFTPELLARPADSERRQAVPGVVAVQAGAEAALADLAKETAEGALHGIVGVGSATWSGRHRAPGQPEQPGKVALP